MKIRKVLKSDRSNMITLFNSIREFTTDEVEVVKELLGIYLDDLKQKDYLFYVTEEDDSKLSSFICFGPTPMTMGTYDLYWIGTAESHERKGLAKSLITFFIDYLKQNNGRLIRIETSGQESYQGTVNFYNKNNFTEEARIKNFYSPGDDLIIYTCSVE